MTIHNKKEPIILFIGDIVFFSLALWISLYVRYLSLPQAEVWRSHIIPFGLLFIAWALVFFIAGLYEKQTVILKSRLPAIILQTQVFNSILAVVFFYFIPYFGITPKTNLFIDLVISFILILFWRLYLYPFIGAKKKQNALLIGSGKEIQELREEVNSNSRYGLHFISSVDLDRLESLDFQEEILNRIYSEGVSVIVIDLRNPKAEPLLPHLYNLIFSNIVFIDKHRIYEDIFNKIPLSLVKYSWFLENISSSTSPVYDFLKRLMDIVVSAVSFILVIPLTVLAAIAIKLDDGGPIFSFQKRVGKNNHIIELIKLRTMDFNDEGDWKEKGRVNKITRIGRFLRKSRLDEIQQVWNVFKGDISLVGPRPEFPEPVKHYVDQIPYYNVRHILKPGLSGWAQIYHEQHPHHSVDVDETRNKLSYDLYYIKNRSFILDIKIALRTIQILVSQKGK